MNYFLFKIFANAKKFSYLCTVFQYDIMNERQRIEKIIEAEQVTAREFAAQVGISAGTLSNILSGRNNPSLDVMKAILNVYRNISSDWLILNAGTMYRSGGKDKGAELPFDGETEITADEASSQGADSDSQSGSQSVTGAINSRERVKVGARGREMPSGVKKVQKILIFYTDGTFEER